MVSSIGHSVVGMAHRLQIRFIYAVMGKNIELRTEPLNGKFQHDGDLIGRFNPMRHKLEGEKTQQ